MFSKQKKSSPGGYTDTVYRSRQTRGFESKSRCCCFYFTRSVLLLFLLAFLVAAGGLSVVSVVFGYSQRWTYSVNRNVSPAFSIRTGWLYFSDNRMAPGARSTLKDLAKASYILGIISLAMSCLSVIFALLFAIRALCGRVGRGFICFSIPYSILLIAAFLGYYIVTALEVWKWQDRVVGSSRVAWPDWAWGLGAGSAVAWFIAAGCASVLPKRHKYLDADEEFEPSRATPAPAYQAPVQGTPVNMSPRQTSYKASPPEPSAPDGPLDQPVVTQEKADKEPVEGKKSFVPSWSRRSATKDTNGKSVLGNGAAYEAPPGTYRTRAEEVATKYRSRDRSPAVSVEMAPNATQSRKGAW